jgi:hypothetical protein
MSTTKAPILRDNYGRPRSEYIGSLEKMTDEQLMEETESKIWLSGFANNNPRSDYHWHVKAIYREWNRRGKVEQYAKAYKAVTSSL